MQETSASATSAQKPVAESGGLPQMALHNLVEFFADRSSERRVKSLLSDVATLRAWQGDAHVSNAIRDSMTKLGSKWQVPQKTRGKKKSSTRHSRRARARVPGVRRAPLGDEYTLYMQASMRRASSTD